MKWDGIYLRVDNRLLFQSKENFGLGLTSIIDHYERIQLIKCELLQNSIYLTVQKLYHIRADKNAKLSKVWKATNLPRVADAKVDTNRKFPTQNNNKGIGFGNVNPNP